MQNSKDLAAALLKAAEQAASGTANVEQCSVLCQCTDSLVKLAKLQIEAARYDVPLGIRWLDSERLVPEKPEPVQENIHVVQAEEKSTTSGRIKDIEREISQAQAQLKTSTPTMRKILEDKIQQWQDKLKFIKATSSKASQ